MKKILLIGLLFLGVVGGVWWVRARVVEVVQVAEVAKAEQVQLTVDFSSRGRSTLGRGDGVISTSSAEFRPGLTAYDLLNTLAVQKGWKVETKQYDFGVFVKAVNGYESTAEKAWIYFVNGKSGDVAADKYIIKAGDKVEWKYEAIKN